MKKTKRMTYLTYLIFTFFSCHQVSNQQIYTDQKSGCKDPERLQNLLELIVSNKEWKDYFKKPKNSGQKFVIQKNKLFSNDFIKSNNDTFLFQSKKEIIKGLRSSSIVSYIEIPADHYGTDSTKVYIHFEYGEKGMGYIEAIYSMKKDSMNCNWKLTQYHTVQQCR